MNLGLTGERVVGLARYIVLGLDVCQAIKRFDGKDEKFDIIFLDPPYYQGIVPRGRKNNIAGRSGSMVIGDESLSKKTLKIISRYDIVLPNALIICQHFKKDSLPEVVDDFKLIKQGKYGDTLLSFYRKE